jgi:hypothetical protein
MRFVVAVPRSGEELGLVTGSERQWELEREIRGHRRPSYTANGREVTL